MTVFIPRSLQEATDLIAEHPDAHLLTGGTDLMVEVNFNHRRPEKVISLGKIEELRQVIINDDHVIIGAAVPYSQMEKGELGESLPALAEAARTVGSPQIRAAGSLGGNLGTCSPAGDSLPVLSATNSIVHLTSAGGTRMVPFSEFMTGPKRNSRQPHEIITAVTVPRTSGWQGYAKVGTRNAMVISVASACVVFHDDELRIALGSVGPTIIRCTDTENWYQSLASKNATGVSLEIGSRASQESRPIDDHRSTADYRRHAIKVLAQRLFERGMSK
jgi:CO/xanthine dehydrogenase FAD-binding subunit